MEQLPKVLFPLPVKQINLTASTTEIKTKSSAEVKIDPMKLNIFHRSPVSENKRKYT